MGVTSLWDLLESASRPVDLAHLRGKVLAVDISIWLVQLVKGMRDSRGNAIPDAHLVGLFSRIAMLLFNGVKPVFVFDGGAPALKQQTIATRRQHRRTGEAHLANIHTKLLHNALREHALTGTFAQLRPTGAAPATDMFALPAAPLLPPPSDQSNDDDDDGTTLNGAQHRGEDPATQRLVAQLATGSVGLEEIGDNDGALSHGFLEAIYDDNTMDDDDDDDDDDNGNGDSAGDGRRVHRWHYDTRNIDVEAPEFQALPLEVQHEIIIDLQERHKNKSSNGAIPATDAVSFSEHQIASMVKRSLLSKRLDVVRQQLLALETADGVQVHKIMSEGNTVYILEKETAPAPAKEHVSWPLPSPQGPARHRPALSEEALCALQQRRALATATAATESTDQGGDLDSGDDDTASSLSFASDHDMEVDVELSELPVSLSGAVPLVASHADQQPLFELHGDESARVSTQVLLDDDLAMSEDEEKEEKPTMQLTSMEPTYTAPINAMPELVSVLPVTLPLPPPPSRPPPATLALSDSEDENEMEIEVVPVVSVEPTKLLTAVEPSSETITFVLPTAAFLPPPPFSPPPLSPPTLSLSPSPPSLSPPPPLSPPSPPQHQHDQEEQQRQEQDRVVTTEQLQTERVTLHQDAARLARTTAEITHEMLLDAQHLLRLFGIPFVIAPMEAEAQCAFLEMAGLTAGTITDDSDIFLFGAKNVYRRLFSKSKDAEFYRATDVESVLGLNRDKLIDLAYLLGCDYTPGVVGVGIVLAMEILADFGATDPLEDFRTWTMTLTSDAVAPWDESKVRKHIRALKKPLVLPPGFPDLRVAAAFRSPTVDTSLELFDWGEFDLDGLCGFANDKLHWSRSRTEQMLRPLIEQQAATAGKPVAPPQQRTLDTFVTVAPMLPASGHAKATKKSSRLDMARQAILKQTLSPTKNPVNLDDDTTSATEVEAPQMPLPRKRKTTTAAAADTVGDPSSKKKTARKTAKHDIVVAAAASAVHDHAVLAKAYQLWLAAQSRDFLAENERPSAVWAQLSEENRGQWLGQATSN